MSDSQSGVRWYYLANEWTNNIAAVTALEVDGQTYTAEAIVDILRQSRQPDSDLATAWRLLAEAQERARAAEADAAQYRRCVESVAHFWRNDPLAFGDDATIGTMAVRFSLLGHLCCDTLELRDSGAALLAELEAARDVVAIARRGFGTAVDVLKAEAFDPVALTHAIERYDAARGRASAEREGK